MQPPETRLSAEADRFLYRLSPLDLQNGMQLTIKIFLLFMVCLLGFWLRNAPLLKVVGNPIADGNVFKKISLLKPIKPITALHTPLF